MSIALPGSILDNAQSPELRTYLAGQVARAAVIYNIDEIVIFDETGEDAKWVSFSFRPSIRIKYVNGYLTTGLCKLLFTWWRHCVSVPSFERLYLLLFLYDIY